MSACVSDLQDDPADRHPTWITVSRLLTEATVEVSSNFGDHRRNTRRERSRRGVGSLVLEYVEQSAGVQSQLRPVGVRITCSFRKFGNMWRGNLFSLRPLRHYRTGSGSMALPKARNQKWIKLMDGAFSTTVATILMTSALFSRTFVGYNASLSGLRYMRGTSF